MSSEFDPTTFEPEGLDQFLKDANLRKAYADSLALTLDSAHPSDAVALCLEYLESAKTGGPVLGDPFGLAVADARFWAECAPLHERVAYGVASLDTLRSASLGISTRKRLFAAIWETFSNDDRVGFLTKVDPEGKFCRRPV